MRVLHLNVIGLLTSNMKKRNVLVLSSIAVGLFSIMTISTLAWFENKISIPAYNIEGSSAGAYFAYGNGKTLNDTTGDKPFGISTPRHLYNLAWLQYNGNFDSRQYYFELANNINMSGWELPPIGTEDSPFLGNFNGNGYTISNVTISNKASFTQKPTKVDYDVQPEIVGFFGVVGKLPDTTTTYTYDSSINTLYDVTLENITVESVTTNTLIGLAAGYVSADMSGVKVGKSTLKVNGNSATGYTDHLSDYN